VKRLNKGAMTIKKQAPLCVMLLVLAGIPLVVKSPYILHLFIMAFITAVLGMSFNMVYSTRLITLGSAAFYGIGAYSSTLLALDWGLSFWIALPMAVIITGIISLGIGLVIIRTGTLTFVILTLLFALAFYQLLGSVRFLGGWAGFINIPRPDPIPVPFLGRVSFTSRVPYYYLGLFLMLSVMLVFYSLYSSRIGRAWKAIKQSSPLAASMGINVYRFRVLGFVVASCASGAVGSFYAHYFQIIIPEMFSGFVSIYIQLYATLGGLEFYIIGPSIGAAVMIFVPEILGVTPEIQPIIFGGLLITIIVFFPGGILGLVQIARSGATWEKLSRRVKVSVRGVIGNKGIDKTLRRSGSTK